MIQGNLKKKKRDSPAQHMEWRNAKWYYQSSGATYSVGIHPMARAIPTLEAS